MPDDTFALSKPATKSTTDTGNIASPTVAPDTAFELLTLDPKGVSLFRTPGGTVRLTLADPKAGPERSYLIVRIARAFPWSLPDEYIGLRDGKDKEIGVLETLESLNAESRAILDDELARRYFIPKVVRILEVKEERGGLAYFKVETDRGEREFYVQNPRDSCQNLSAIRILVTDKDGFRYEFPDITQYDGKGQAFFERVT
jgi:hypothetical protein